MNSNLLSYAGKMFPDFILPTPDAICSASSVSFKGSGIVEHGEFLMLNTSEWPSADEGSSVCSLAEILEPCAARKYYLSPKACAGILRRAEKRGKDLPPTLYQALKQVAEGRQEQERAEGKTRLLQSKEHLDFTCPKCGEMNAGTWWPTCEWCDEKQEQT